MTTINFNFYINGNKTNALAEALGAAFAVSAATDGEHGTGTYNNEPAAAAQAETATAAQAAQEVSLRTKILNVLNDKSKYRKRSLEAIAKAVGVASYDVEEELQDMIYDGAAYQSSASGLYYV